MNKSAIIYCRFSPRRNADECESIETQLDYCQRLCDLNQLAVVAEYHDEALSGASMANRPGLLDALDHACRVKAALVFYSLSRLARNTKEAIEIAERLKSAGADMVSYQEKIDTTSSYGKFIFTIFAALAELERNQIAERTKDAMLFHQAGGRRMSKLPPFGWTVDPDDPARLIEHTTEQATIRRIVECRKQGMGYRAICRWLDDNGHQGRGSWHHQKVKNILQRQNNPSSSIPSTTPA